MTEHRGLLAAILAEPHADDLRLIYADWLEENGQAERAEFIRVQVEYARLAGIFAECRGFSWHRPDCVAGTPGRIACNRLRILRERTGSILGDPECRHCDWHAPIGHGDAFTWEYRRGFIAAVRCPLAAWEQHGPALVSRHPAERVELSDREPESRTGGTWPPIQRWGWTWAPDAAPRAEYFGQFPACLPESIWGRFTFRNKSGSDFQLREFESPEEAHDALSDACLAWARQLAEERGLMP